MANDPVYKEQAKNPQRQGTEWGQYLTLAHPNDRFSTAALGFAADTFWAVDQVLPDPYREIRRTRFVRYENMYHPPLIFVLAAGHLLW